MATIAISTENEQKTSEENALQEKNRKTTLVKNDLNQEVKSKADITTLSFFSKSHDQRPSNVSEVEDEVIARLASIQRVATVYLLATDGPDRTYNQKMIETFEDFKEQIYANPTISSTC